MNSFGSYLRQQREALRLKDRAYSVRQVAKRIGIEPAYLSKIERDEVAPPSEEAISRLAEDLGEDRDALLALGGKVSSDLLELIRLHPVAFAELIRGLRDAPPDALLRVVREVRDGDCTSSEHSRH